MLLTRRTVVVLSLLAGVLVGGLVAALAGADRWESRATAGLKLAVQRTAPPLRRPEGLLGWRARAATVQVVARAADPGGGPDWAIRRSEGRNLLPPGVPLQHIGKELLGDHVYYELGRIDHERFGWLDGTGTFRTVAPGDGTLPRYAFGSQASVRERQDVGSVTLLSHPAFGEPQPVATVVWGVSDEATRTVTLDDGGHDADVTLGDHGAFVSFLPARGAAPKLDVQITDAAGTTKKLGARFNLPGAREPLADRARLMARTPDPSGAAPWGLSAAPARAGGWCTSNPGRIVDGAIGQLDTRLDLFYDQTAQVSACPVRRKVKEKYRALTRTRPLSYVFTAGTMPSQERPDDTGRTALRTLPGALVFAGIARPDVRLITVTTPEQTRVLHPTGAAHGFAVAFAGSFPSGAVRFDVTFADGAHVIQTEHVGDI
jgi:hypothetical protein